MPAGKFKVRHGCTIFGPNREKFIGGAVLPDDLFTPAQIEEHVKSKFAVPVNPSEAIPEAPKIVEDVPGRENPVVLTGTKEETSTTVTTESGPGGEVTATGGQNKTSTPVSQRQSEWDLDPATLQGKSLEELNVMVAERDSKVKPFDDANEVISFLSQDYKPKK